MSKQIDVTQLLRELGDTKKSGLPHLSELAESFLRQAGGPEAFASLLYQEFQKAPQGSLVRAQLFGMIQKVWKYATEQLRVEDPESLSDDELNKEIKQTILELMADAATDAPDHGAADRPAPARSDR